MKRLILLGACSLLIFGSTFTNAQCVPDVTLTIPGLYPDSATGLPAGTVGTAYSQVIQIRVPTDTVFMGTNVTITSIEVTGVTGLPPGITYACNPANCVFAGGSNACVLLSGNPSTAGSYPINVNVLVSYTVIGIPGLPLPQSFSYYTIVINQATGLPSDITQVGFGLLQNTPNPAIEYTDIQFTSPINGDFKLKIFNLIGKEVYNQVVRGVAGSNSVRLETENFSPGIYMISIDNGNDIVTRRMIVSKK